MKVQDEWVRENFKQRELTETHRSIEEEFSFYEAVKNGDIAYVRKNCEDNEFLKAVGMGILSDDPLQNMRYHFITTAALVTRFCVEGGMELELAYGLSDFYITKMDKARTEKEVVKIHHAMVLDYTSKMNVIKNRQSVSKAVRQSIDYIFLHLHGKITLDELAENANVSPGYLSKLFKKEMNISITDYICDKKIESAKNLLKYSNLSVVEISNHLAFASQSYFIKVFHLNVGMTPKKYREKFFRRDQSYIWK